MSVEVSLFGFGDVRPAVFGQSDSIQLALAPPITPVALLRAAGFDDTRDLLLIVDDELLLASDWDRARIDDGASVRIMSAIEGG